MPIPLPDGYEGVSVNKDSEKQIGNEGEDTSAIEKILNFPSDLKAAFTGTGVPIVFPSHDLVPSISICLVFSPLFQGIQLSSRNL